MKQPPKLWYALDVVIDPVAAEALEYALTNLGSIGTEIDRIRKNETDPFVVTGYFSEHPDDRKIQDSLCRALNEYGLQEMAVLKTEWRIVEEQDWLQEWKKHWKATRVGRFVIAPPWEKLDADPKSIVIRIEPNMAFGTGTHETTRLCLKAIDEHFERGMSFFDVGTGTGILAIAAAKINNSPSPKIVGYDTDKDSIAIARENARKNGVGPKIRFEHGPLANEAPVYDLVCANLMIDVILPILPLLLEKSGQILVLSGILVEQEGQAISELKELGISDLTIDREGEWLSILIRR